MLDTGLSVRRHAILQQSSYRQKYKAVQETSVRTSRLWRTLACGHDTNDRLGPSMTGGKLRPNYATRPEVYYQTHTDGLYQRRSLCKSSCDVVRRPPEGLTCDAGVAGA